LDDSLCNLVEIENSSDRQHNVYHVDVCIHFFFWRICTCSEAKPFKALRNTIHESFRTIESVEEQFASIMQTETHFTPDLKHPVLQVCFFFLNTRYPRLTPPQFRTVYANMGKCAGIKLDFDEYDIKKRASAFLDNWETIVSRFETVQQPAS
jgi:hypothetical protein